MAIDVRTNPETLDFSLTSTGDLEVTSDVVYQDAWKRCVLPKGNFQFDLSIGSLLYRVAQFGNTRAARALAVSYVKLALDDDIRSGRIEIERVDVTDVTAVGCRLTIRFRDLTTGATSTIDL